MKTKVGKIYITIIILVIIEFLPLAVMSQNGPSSTKWRNIGYAGTINNKKAYSIYYNSKDKPTFVNDGCLFLETQNLYTRYGRCHYKDIGIKSRFIRSTINVWVVDINNDRFRLAGYIDVYKNDDALTTVIDPNKWEWIYPATGSVGECYIKMTKKMFGDLDTEYFDIA